MEAAKARSYCKIRKRGNSSSSSSSLVQKYRFKRAILVGKRGGSTTPVPAWRTTTQSSNYAMPNDESTKCELSLTGSKAKEVSVSTRKLAAALWEINRIPSPTAEKDLELLEDRKEFRSRSMYSRLPHFPDPSYILGPKKIDRSREDGHWRRTSVIPKILQPADYNLEGLDSTSNVSLMEIEAHTKGKAHTRCAVGIKTRLKGVSNGLTTSKELVKVLSHIWDIQEQHSWGMSLVSALGVELERARHQVNQLIKEQISKHDEIDHLIKHFEEEKAAWKNTERNRVQSAIARIAEELEVEKKLRMQTERLNKKLGQELADKKASLSKALKELESEKRGKEILEQVCDELAKGIGEDRVEVEKLKRESAKVREEIEKEREMLQLADVLREERVQMKLSEAKYHFEEKNAAVERLRNDLENYVRERLDRKMEGSSPDHERIKELEAYLEEVKFGSWKNLEKEENEEEALAEGEVDDGVDSVDSDLHSIELNMDNSSRSYQWSYSCEGNYGFRNPKLAVVDNGIKARKSISDNIQWESISLHRRNANGTEGAESEFSSKKQETERLPELGSHSQVHDLTKCH
ncbi:hypothetical protein K2173_014161 [Erythroxylum novogranatense]|uniref:Uncharacterized protein n=1 Tax=Erythroxylum novogranatense TaxID=1862640 RepID=A0AAV8SDF9_9ROSI|nr:hypothetical protein K2173_014161 [Erythroxylum novogranatense]